MEHTKNQLAVDGGTPVRDVATHPWPKWPVWDRREEQGLLDVLHSGVWSYNGPNELAFNNAFADFIGTKHAICAANGTVTLQLALEACGIGLGDEVIVPGLTWQATAASILDINAVPILVDICEDTWCLNPDAFEDAVTPNTKAVIPVHLYGCFTDMDRVMAIARKHDLRVIEDCAHKHGGAWKGQKAGSIGDIGSFSFQLSKILTAGEGGALTTNDPDLAAKLDALRNCGRRTEKTILAEKSSGIYESEGDYIQSGNYRITEFQAAVLLEGLKRLPEQNRIREENALYVNGLLAEIPGILPMRRDERETAETYYNFTFRYRKETFGGLPVTKFREALSKELGCPVGPSNEPLNRCSLYKPHTKPWRYRLSNDFWSAVDPSRFDLPVCETIFYEQAVCLHHNVLMGTKSDMDLIAEAVTKIYKNAETLARP